MKNLERRIDGPGRKFEGCIWSSLSNLGLGALCYCFEDKGEPWKHLSKLAGYYCAYWLISNNVVRKEYSVNFPQQESFTYKIFNREIYILLFTITVSFARTKLLMFYSVIMPDIGNFANLRKTTISLVLSVCPYLCIEKLGSHWTDFDEIWSLYVFFENMTRTIKFHKNRTRMTVVCMKTRIDFDHISLSSV
jgi:hypothetical protein